MSDVSAPFQVGDTVDGRYLVESALAATNFSWIFRAVQVSTGQQVAVKILRTGMLPDAGRLEVERRFQRETAIYARVRHPNLVRLLDTGFARDNLYLVLDFIEGETLTAVLRRERCLDPFATKRMLGQCLDALAAGHGRGIVHRDFKPGNVMITTTGTERQAVVLDFGLAGLEQTMRTSAAATFRDDPITNPGTVMGTPWYMAPEQLDGQVTAQSDIFAWAMVVIECLTGTRPNPERGDLTRILDAVREPIVLPPWLESHPLGRILQRATALDRAERFPSAEAVLAELRACPVADLVDVAPAPVRRDLPPDDSILGTVQIALAADPGPLSVELGMSFLVHELGELTSRAPVPASAQEGPALDQDVDKLFDDYLRICRAMGQLPELTREELAERARRDATWLRASLGCRAVRFRLVIDEDLIRLQAVPLD